MSRRNLYVAGAVAASMSYIFNVLAFTGSLDIMRFVVFMALFLVVMVGFERFIDWSETLEA